MNYHREEFCSILQNVTFVCDHLNSLLVVKKVVVEILFVPVILTGDFFFSGTVQAGSFFVPVCNIFP